MIRFEMELLIDIGLEGARQCPGKVAGCRETIFAQCRPSWC